MLQLYYRNNHRKTIRQDTFETKVLLLVTQATFTANDTEFTSDSYSPWSYNPSPSLPTDYRSAITTQCKNYWVCGFFVNENLSVLIRNYLKLLVTVCQLGYYMIIHCETW